MQHCTSTLRRPLPPRPPSRWPGQPPPSPAGVALVHDSPGARDPQEESKSVAAVLAGLLDRPLSLPAPSGGVPRRPQGVTRTEGAGGAPLRDAEGSGRGFPRRLPWPRVGSGFAMLQCVFQHLLVHQIPLSRLHRK